MKIWTMGISILIFISAPMAAKAQEASTTQANLKKLSTLMHKQKVDEKDVDEICDLALKIRNSMGGEGEEAKKLNAYYSFALREQLKKAADDTEIQKEIKAVLLPSEKKAGHLLQDAAVRKSYDSELTAEERNTLKGLRSVVAVGCGYATLQKEIAPRLAEKSKKPEPKRSKPKKDDSRKPPRMRDSQEPPLIDSTSAEGPIGAEIDQIKQATETEKMNSIPDGGVRREAPRSESKGAR